MLSEIKLRDDYQVAPQLSTYYYYINVNDPILKDVRIRKALSMALDRQELVDKVTMGGQIPATALVPPMPGYTPAKGNGFNLAEAQKLLADAGYPNGEGFPTMTVIYNTNEGHKKIAEYVQQAWKKNLGINVTLENMEWATFLDVRQNNNFQIARAGWVGDYQDASNFLELLLSDGGNNDGRYNNPEYDALLKKAALMPAGQARLDVLMQAESIMISQDQGMIPFYYYVSQNMIDLSKWDGWYTNTLDIHPWVGIKRK
jgi:oligopeptide transport system substrate-binding protein